MEPLDALADPDSTPSWTRPEKQRFRLLRAVPVLGGLSLIGVSLIAGMLLAGEGAAPDVIAVPMFVQVPGISEPPIMPAPTPPEPQPTVVEPTPIAYRATTPTLDADCVGTLTADATTPACTWDSGFPAISADGSQIVEAIVPDDGGRGNPGLIVVFTDVATSKQVRSVTILSPDESEPGAPLGDKLRATMQTRAAAAQRLIDTRRFRSLIDLGVHSPNHGDDIDVPGDATGIHAEYIGDTMRLLDPATKTALWRHKFATPSPWAHPDPDKECQSWYLAELQTWWDPQARVVLGRSLYHHGGCMCGSTSIAQAFRL